MQKINLLQTSNHRKGNIYDHWNWTFLFLFFWETLKLNTNKRGNKQFHARINVIQVEINHIMWVNKKNDISNTVYLDQVAQNKMITCICCQQKEWPAFYSPHINASLPELLFRCFSTQFDLIWFFCRVHNSIMISWLLLYFLIYP